MVPNKTKTYNRYTQEIKEGNQAYHYRKSASHKEREQKRKTRELQNSQKTMNKKALVSLHLLMITLNVNGLNYQIKRHRVAEWIKKYPSCMLPARYSLQL